MRGAECQKSTKKIDTRRRSSRCRQQGREGVYQWLQLLFQRFPAIRGVGMDRVLATPSPGLHQIDAQHQWCWYRTPGPACDRVTAVLRPCPSAGTRIQPQRCCRRTGRASSQWPVCTRGSVRPARTGVVTVTGPGKILFVQGEAVGYRVAREVDDGRLG